MISVCVHLIYACICVTMQLRLHSQGYRTLDELKESGQLNRHQLIGLAHYDEFLERMPREEAGEIEQTVQQYQHSYIIIMP